MRERKLLLSILQHMLKRGPIASGVGICGNIANNGHALGLSFDDWFNAGDHFLCVRHRLFRDWPDYSGWATYPVPLATKGDCADYSKADGASWAYDTMPKWSGAQGILRRSLLWHCIKVLRRMSDKEFYLLIKGGE